MDTAMTLTEITAVIRKAAAELIEKAKLREGQILVVGCSTSEISGFAPGTHSGPEIGKALLDGILPLCKERGVFLAAQCCEHLNRAIVIDAAAAEKYGFEPVNAVPQPKAGGSFATALYNALEVPVVVEHIKAHAGLDIGGVLIGMHLKEVAVPIHLETRKIGEAVLLAARTRPKCIGGERTHYNEHLR